MVEQKLRATLITGRTIDQGVGKEMGKGSKEYFDSSAVCFIDKADMIKLGIKSGTNVKVTSKYGSVIVKAQKYPWGITPEWFSFHAVYGQMQFAATKLSAWVCHCLKGFPVEVEPAPNEACLDLR